MRPLRVVDSFPHAVRRIEHLWIPLRDGCRLAARLWLPESASPSPVPALVEYIPYGKRIGTRDRDDAIHAWFAGHGYACLRIDLRGSGESDGVLRDEYLPLEQTDGCEAIAWIAAQPWCSGAVGLFGKSWGGFNALQIAARRPPALRAVLSVCSTDDRYADDVHYMGGCLLNDNLWWGAVFFQLVAQPPDPALAGTGWRAAWQERLAAAEPHPLRWLGHPLRDAYWRQGSVCEDYAAIACPVYAVGGWADGYRNAVPRLLAALPGPRRGLIGPWGHTYPHEGSPGPAIGFLQEARRWWDRWLRGVRNGIETEPAYRAWMPESVPPGFAEPDRPGRWIAEESWPTATAPRALPLAPGRLGGPGARARLEVRPHQTTGAAAGGWLVSALHDQAEDDARSLCFDSEPLAERTEVLGTPTLRLIVASDRALAFVAARLNDVAPDGRATRVSYGLLNLTHARDHASWAPLVPGRRVEATLEMNHTAHAFPAGHRLRVALSTCYWPLVWPSPEPATLSLWTEGSRLLLPVREPSPRDARLPELDGPECAPRCAWTPLSKGGFERRRAQDPATGEWVASMRSGYDAAGGVALARCTEAEAIEGGDATAVETRIHPTDPLRARAAMRQCSELRRGSWSVAVETDVRISCTREHFRVEASLAAREGGAAVFERCWDERVLRRGV